MAKIAGVFNPRKFVAIKVANDTRLASTANGCTVAVSAASNDVAAARACKAAAVACAAAALNQPTYGVAAATIAADAGPAHGPPANAVITESNELADPYRSAARLSQAAAATCNGPEPAPAKIRAELISGGNHAKSKIIYNPNPASRVNGANEDRSLRLDTHQPMAES
ncbi:hypothetical protein Mkiyose1665_44150 [Mycobacterium kiyosense]|uniref:Uncharacterized protein n=1 Tax=Mycobacterium kiyosense TaxID=2871094 RepID=A0A9P3QAR4_9MYCO|nr:hypothetical protein IWGMT90018_21350 [Mycobacterium kiyosense]BDE15015.1 hypothetical protein MKCMC460_38750 [Mycobacterium sp. 20KCMC460]GLB83689.1 hypothetical protein SRL2020028_29450 [Mycobacterium kiyosense]GLB87723.1 hypothetical protein SRL2020130_05400 [Mycobacterium kiyosense]GLB97165.1 hypothetical protein SRL2020226_39410 [Mycobacterium kiyosense]